MSKNITQTSICFRAHRLFLQSWLHNHFIIEKCDVPWLSASLSKVRYSIRQKNSETWTIHESKCQSITSCLWNLIGGKLMTEHMKWNDIPKFCAEIEKWLKVRYGEVEGTKLWAATSRQYNKYLEDLPDYGGKKTGNNTHSILLVSAIYQSHTIKRIALPDTILHNVRMQNLRKNIT